MFAKFKSKKSPQTKRIAFVDIDDTIIKNGKLNQEVVEKLKDGNYDQIILFSQRSRQVQVENLKHRYFYVQNSNSNELITTSQVVDALTNELKPKKPIKVSSSADTAFGKPMEYYKSKLKSFEDKLFKAFSNQKELGMEAPDISAFKKEIEEDEEAIKKRFGEHPLTKEEQYKSLAESLGPDVEIDFFDDSYANLKGVYNDPTIEKKPNLYSVYKGKVESWGESHYKEIKEIGQLLTDINTLRKSLQKIERSLDAPEDKRTMAHQALMKIKQFDEDYSKSKRFWDTPSDELVSVKQIIKSRGLESDLESLHETVKLSESCHLRGRSNRASPQDFEKFKQTQVGLRQLVTDLRSDAISPPAPPDSQTSEDETSKQQLH
ncbi:hypothetical protein [Legionella waltersii]|uniref:Dot/Icm T4SS effector n=1 Tax=Legionella waltersii TaxID=66969 RepID=A0A0W1AAL6_9GAMM|nr:hypothetical protein [Legionella waltersii]KTD78347.1 hypothetical protein Lwal_1782 [Legionella waltersii]SNV06533.1 Uncharacterised protein [Legionella waltersii]